MQVGIAPTASRSDCLPSVAVLPLAQAAFVEEQATIKSSATSEQVLLETMASTNQEKVSIDAVRQQSQRSCIKKSCTKKTRRNYPIDVSAVSNSMRIVTATVENQRELIPVGYSAFSYGAPLKVFYPNNEHEWFASKHLTCTQFALEIELPINVHVRIDSNKAMIVYGGQGASMVADMQSDYIDLFVCETPVMLPQGMVCTQLYSEDGFKMEVYSDLVSRGSKNIVAFKRGHVYCNLLPCRVVQMIGDTKSVIARFSHSNSNLIYYRCEDDGIMTIEHLCGVWRHEAPNTARLFCTKYTGVQHTFELPKTFTVINSIRTSVPVLVSFSNVPHMKRELYGRGPFGMSCELYNLDSYEYLKQELGYLVLESVCGNSFDVEVFHSERMEDLSMEESLEQQNGIYQEKWSGENATKWIAATEQVVELKCTNEGVVMFKRSICNDAIQLIKEHLKRFYYMKSAHVDATCAEIECVIERGEQIEKMIATTYEQCGKFIMQVGKTIYEAANCYKPRNAFTIYCEERESSYIVHQKMKLCVRDYAKFLADLHHDRALEWKTMTELHLGHVEEYIARSQEEREGYATCHKSLAQRASLPSLEHLLPSFESLSASFESYLCRSKTTLLPFAESKQEKKEKKDVHVIEVQKDALTANMKSILKDCEPEGEFDGTYYFVFDGERKCLGFVRAHIGRTLATPPPSNTKDLSIFCKVFEPHSINVPSIVQKHLFGVDVRLTC